MKEMALLVPDAASYAPVTILVAERGDGVHLPYDLMASFLAPSKAPAALQVAEVLDEKIKLLIVAAAEGRGFESPRPDRHAH